MQQNNKQTWNTVSVFFLFLTHSETKKTVKTWSVKNFDGIVIRTWAEAYKKNYNIIVAASDC